MLRTKQQAENEAKLLNGLTVTLKGQTFTHQKQNKYGALFLGIRNAQYRATISPRDTIIEDEKLPAFYMTNRKGTLIGHFTIVDGIAIECDLV